MGLRKDVIELEFKLHLHNKGYKAKPSGKEIGLISKEITSEVTTITPAELALKVGQEGHTTVLATMNGKRNKFNMIQQQVLMIDFDNTEIIDGKKKKTTGSSYTSIMDMICDPYIQKNASFIYKTLSHKDSWEKFRVAFILDKPMTKIEEVYGAYDFLLNKYPNADKACKDPSRLFFGGTEYITVNFENTLAKDSLHVAVVENPKLEVVKPAKTKVEKAREAVPSVPTGATETYKLIKEGKKEEVASRLSVYKAKVHSKVQAMKYLKSLNMQELFGVQFNPFFDFFHFEKSPSAGIFKMENADIYLYKCHSESHGFTGDVIMVTSKLLDIPYMQALNYLIEVCGIEIEVTEQIKALRDQCDLFLELLLSEDLKDNYPAINNIFWRYKTEIVAILTIFKENIYEDENGNLRSLTWLSVRNLSEKIYGTDRKKDAISRILNLMTYTNWIDKLDESQIPATLLKKIKATQNANKREKRSNVFELLPLGDDFFIQLNKQCEVMKQTGFTMKGFSQEYVARTHGKEVADEVFVQDKNKKISKTSDELVADIHKVVLKMISKKGIAIEKDVLAVVQKKWKSKGFTETKYKQAVSEMLDMYGLERKRLTKDLKEKFEVTNLPKNASPTILLKAV